MCVGCQYNIVVYLCIFLTTGKPTLVGKGDEYYKFSYYTEELNKIIEEHRLPGYSGYPGIWFVIEQAFKNKEILTGIINAIDNKFMERITKSVFSKEETLSLLNDMIIIRNKAKEYKKECSELIKNAIEN